MDRFFKKRKVIIGTVSNTCVPITAVASNNEDEEPFSAVSSCGCTEKHDLEQEQQDCDENVIVDDEEECDLETTRARLSLGTGISEEDAKFITMENPAIKAKWEEILSQSEKKDNGCVIYCGKLDIRRKNAKAFVWLLYTKKMHLEKFVYILHYGPIPQGMFVRVCPENHLCCNPEHLKLKSGKALADEDYNKKKWQSMLAKSVTNEQGCLLWQGKKNDGGYGVVRYRERQLLTHHASWLIHNKELPEGQILRHNCKQGNDAFKNNTECFLIGHLQPGTFVDNSADQVRDGTMPKGETHAMSKLTESQVKEIFAERTKVSIKVRADKYGVHKATVSAIDNGYSWSHVTGASPQKKNAINEKNRQKKDIVAEKNVMAEAWHRMLRTATRRGQFGCLIPRTVPNRQGYSTISIQGVKRVAHIVSYELFANDGKEVEKGTQIRHVVCADRQCAEFSHLQPGTAKENTQDQLIFSDDAKLALKIMESAEENKTLEERATEAGVTINTVKKIDSAESWGWLKDRLILQKVYEARALEVCRAREQQQQNKTQ